MPPIIGVDLGTTNTAVAVLESGRPRVIEDDRGYKVLPSVISAKGEGRFVVGQAAHNLILTRPDRTVYAAKRLIGRRFDSPEVQRVLQRVGYAVREAPDGGVQIQVGDTWMTPQEIAAVVLQVARGIAEKSLGQPVEEAVITVPAHFNHAQRKATMEAAQIAGLRCERLLNEPTAAALAYGHRKNVERTLVIFDLGGGTFDVSVLRLSGGIYEILSTNGDTFLGGEDFDYRLVDHLTDQFKTRTGVDLRKDRSALQRIKDAAERAKCELSFSDRTSLVVPHAAPGQNLETTLTRTQLEELTSDLVDRCIEVAREAVVEAGLTISEVDEVILVGGQTRMPRVREAVAGLFGREASRSVHPEEVVALGAAVHAATLGDVEGTRAILLDVTPFDLGIDAAGGLFSRVVPRNARIPCSETRTFATVHDDQTTVRVTVRQGESRVAEENEFLGEFLFEGLTPAPRMQTKVAVTFRIDANGMLSVSASEPATGEKRNIAIRNYADRSRAVVAAPASALGDEKVGGAAGGSDKKTAKKKGFFDSLFGGGAKPKAKAKAPTPPPGAESAPVSTPAAAAAAVLEPPPTIAPLPTPEPVDLSPMSVEDDPDAVLTGDELDEVEPDGGMAFEMPEELAGVDEEDLYDPATAGPATFGLAGAHQVGEAAAGADPFADLGTPVGRPPVQRLPEAAASPVVAEDVSDVFTDPGLDAAELFGESFDPEEEDPPTDPGLRFRGAPTAPIPVAQPERPPMGGLLFEEFLDDAAGAGPVEAGGVDEIGDPFTADEPAPGKYSAAEPTGDVFSADVFGFAMAEPDEAASADEAEIDFSFDEPAPAARPATTAAPVASRSLPAPEELDADLFALAGDEGADLLALAAEAAAEADAAPGPAVEAPMFAAPAAEPVEDSAADLAVDLAADLGGVNPFGFSLPEPVVPLEEPVRSSRRKSERTDGIVAAPPPRPARVEESTEIFRRPTRGALDEERFAFPMPDEEPAPEVKKRKPARVKLAYREREQLVTEYRANLQKGGALIRTEKPLATGRECVFEVNGPGLDAPLVIPARVTRVVVDGMEVVYDLDEAARGVLLQALGG